MFHLHTSCGSLIPVDSQILAVHSSVFRDLLKLPGEQDDKCEVSESKEEIELMLQVLEEPKNSYNLVELETIARLSDKYECPMLRAIARFGYWTFVSSHKQPVAALQTVFRLRDEDLICAFAVKAAESFTNYDQLKSLDCPEDIKIRLDRLRLRRLDYARQILVKPRSLGQHCALCRLSTPTAASTWKSLVEAELEQISPARMSSEALHDDIKARAWHLNCFECARSLFDLVKQVMKEWKAAPKEL